MVKYNLSVSFICLRQDSLNIILGNDPVNTFYVDYLDCKIVNMNFRSLSCTW